MRWRTVLLLTAAAFAQDGGRDDAGTADRPMLFVRWERTDESGAVARAA